MRKVYGPALEHRRLVRSGGRYDTLPGDQHGAFFPIIHGQEWNVIASSGLGWEHVSVSSPRRTPPWEIMAAIKDLFWEPEEAVMQLHPPASTYVNHHPHCLHLWRPLDASIPLPDPILVGPRP